MLRARRSDQSCPRIGTHFLEKGFRALRGENPVAASFFGRSEFTGRRLDAMVLDGQAQVVGVQCSNTRTPLPRRA